MTEIKRYEVVLVDGVPAHRPSESGRWVKHGDLAELQDQLQRYSMSAGQADQRKAESDAVRVALGLSADADDVAPCDLVDAIAALQEQVRALAAENAALKNANSIANNILNDEETMVTSLWASSVQNVQFSTPATDAALREIRAQAVESFMSWSDSYIEEGDEYEQQLREVSSACKVFAARIRAGEQP